MVFYNFKFCIAKLFQETTLLPVSVQTMDKAVMLSCNNSPSAQRQHRNLQIKATDLTSFLQEVPFSTPSVSAAPEQHLCVPCRKTFSSRLAARPSGSAPCPAAQHTRLSAGRDLHTPLQHWGPGIWEEWKSAKCEKCLSRSTLKSTASCRHTYPSQPAWGALWRHSRGCSAQLSRAPMKSCHYTSTHTVRSDHYR